MKRKGLKIFLIISIVLFVILGLGLIAISPYLSTILEHRNEAFVIAAASSPKDFRSTETSIIYDINGEEITDIRGAAQLYYLESSEIPQIVKTGFVLLEDRKFYKHNGIDIAAIIRAGLENIKKGRIVQGASTITQQLVKDIYLTQDVTWARKITEAFLAVELEKKYSKEQILEFYINNIYFANGLYGIEAAAQGYFDTSASELTISELALLIGIPKNPSKFNPVKNYDKAIERRDFILKLLKDNKAITEEEYDIAKQETIILTPKEKKKCDYVETYVFYCATKALMEANGFVFRDEFINEKDEELYDYLYESTYTKYQRSLFTAGYRIYTSIDMKKQELLQACVNDALAEHTDTNDEGVYKLQAAAVCIDNSTGMVSAIVGGRDQKMPGYTLNRAYQSFRQPGSSIKPLIVYAPFLQLGHNPDYVVDDSYMPDGPKNFEDRYPGESTVMEALAWSSNVVTWKLFEEITPQYGMSFLKEMNFKRVGNDDEYMASALGGFTNGVSCLEMASAYASFPSEGLYREPTAVMWITDSKNQIIVENTKKAKIVYDYNAARMINKILQYGVQSGLAVNADIDNAVVAAKTGTTTSNKDGWIAGYSMYYTTAVWVGYDIPVSDPAITGGTYPMTIWTSFMNEIHEGMAYKEFPDYYEYEQKNLVNNEENNEENNNPDDEKINTDSDADTDIGDEHAQGDEAATKTQGDKDASLTDTDKNAGDIAGGDEAATKTQGDKDASLTDADKNAGDIAGGDETATKMQGDKDASLTDTDKNAGHIAGGDETAAKTQGDEDALVVESDKNAEQFSGDRDAQ